MPSKGPPFNLHSFCCGTKSLETSFSDLPAHVSAMQACFATSSSEAFPMRPVLLFNLSGGGPQDGDFPGGGHPTNWISKRDSLDMSLHSGGVYEEDEAHA
jgi:hypothetical protein